MSSLSVSIRTALSGLETIQQGIATTSNNISNAQTVGYTRKRLVQESIAIGGVQVKTIERDIDDKLVRQMRSQLSISSHYNTKAEILGQLQDFFSSPSNNRTLTRSLSELSIQIETMIDKPQSLASRKNFVNSARQIAFDFNVLSKKIQEIRFDTEKRISDAIVTINEKLDIIHDLNVKIQRANNINDSSSDFLDKRDKALKELSEYIDVETFNRPDGRIAIFTGDGKPLVDSVVNHLSHLQASTINIDQSYNSAAPLTGDSGFGGIEGIFVGDKIASNDITSSIRHGKLKGLIDARDTILHNLSNDIEKLAVSFQKTVNKIHNDNTGFPPPTTLTGTRLFSDPATTGTIELSSSVKIALLDADGAVSNYAEIPAGVYADANALVTAINTTNTTGTPLGSIASIDPSGGPLILQHGSLGIGIIDTGTQTITQTPGAGGPYQDQGFSNFFGLNDLFVDDTSEFGNLTVSETIKVRADLISDPMKLAHGKLGSGDHNAVTVGNTVISIGDDSGFVALSEALDSQMSITANLNFTSKGETPFTRTLNGDLPDLNVTLSSFASSIISSNTTLAKTAQNQGEFEQQLFDTLEFRSDSISGVNIDEEMANIIVLQQAFSAAARVVTVSSEMLEILSNIGR